MLTTFGQDLRYGARKLRSAPGFTVVAVLTLAIGIGAVAAVFGLFRALVLRPMPVRDPGSLVALYTSQAIVFLVYPLFRGRPSKLEWVAVAAATGLAAFGLEVVISQQPYT